MSTFRKISLEIGKRYIAKLINNRPVSFKVFEDRGDCYEIIELYQSRNGKGSISKMFNPDNIKEIE